jgi:hypothetical protein
MANVSVSLDKAPILAPADAKRLREVCPDIDEWAKSWRFDDSDIPPGQQIVDVFAGCILDMLNQGLAVRTIKRHRDNLWALGGHLIKRRYDDKKLARMEARDALLELVGDDEGPLIYDNAVDQNPMDGTCRKLNRFLRADPSA